MTATIALVIAWIVCFTGLNVLLKRGVGHLSLENGVWPLAQQLALSPWLYVAVALYGACALFYLVSLRLLPLSTAGPIYMTLGVFASALTGLIYFSEPVNAVKIAGLGLCVGGIALLAFSSSP